MTADGWAGAARRSEALAARLQEVAAVLIAVVESIEDDRWGHVPAQGVWSIGKEAEHVAEAAVYHSGSSASRSVKRCRRDGPLSSET